MAWKLEKKRHLFTADKLLCRKFLRFYQKINITGNDFNKVVGYRRTQKIVEFVILTRSHPKLKNNSIYNIVKNKTLRINLAKKAKDLYIKNYKPFLKEIEEDTNGKASCVQGLDDFLLLKCSKKSCKNNQVGSIPHIICKS